MCPSRSRKALPDRACRRLWHAEARERSCGVASLAPRRLALRVGPAMRRSQDARRHAPALVVSSASSKAFHARCIAVAGVLGEQCSMRVGQQQVAALALPGMTSAALRVSTIGPQGVGCGPIRPSVCRFGVGRLRTRSYRRSALWAKVLAPHGVFGRVRDMAGWRFRHAPQKAPKGFATTPPPTGVFHLRLTAWCLRTSGSWPRGVVSLTSSLRETHTASARGVDSLGFGEVLQGSATCREALSE